MRIEGLWIAINKNIACQSDDTILTFRNTYRTRFLSFLDSVKYSCVKLDFWSFLPFSVEVRASLSLSASSNFKTAGECSTTFLSEFSSGDNVADIKKPWQICGKYFMISVTSEAYPVRCNAQIMYNINYPVNNIWDTMCWLCHLGCIRNTDT